MKHIKTILASVAVGAALVSCNMGDFGDINISPNSPSEGFTSMLFTYSARQVRVFTMNAETYDPWTQLRTGYLAESKNNQYGPMGTTKTFSTGNYYTVYIKNLNEIIAKCEDPETNTTVAVTSFGDPVNQIAVARTLRAFFFMTLTDILGPIPYSEAFKGESDGIWEPKFDSQESIYAALDADLQEAYAQFNTAGSLSEADILYGGDISKWKKFNASLRMMMAIKMADVDPANGKARFAKAYADGGMTEVADGFHYTFDSNNAYAWMYYTGNMNYGARDLNFVPNKVIVDALKEHKDPRMFSYFTLDGYKGKVEGDPTDVESYQGVPFGLESNPAVVSAAVGCCSVNATYCEQAATYGVITTARTLLVEAEAAELGWISADPKALYEAGIRASFDFQATYHSAVAGVEEYLASDKVVLSDNKDEAIKQIVMQRFLAGFMTDGIEAWSDWRRFNIPVLPVYKGMADEGITVYPYRMLYADTDKQYNVENSTAAINQWLGGSDDRWARVWWDVADNE